MKTQSLWLNNFIDIYSELGTDNLADLERVYHPEVEFTDPMHSLRGFDRLLTYFEDLYQQIISCDFVIEHAIESGTEAAVYWTMTLRHKQLNAGQPIRLEGHSHLRASEDRVIYHRDYFDLGAMLYEHLPLLGRVIRAIKNRAGK